AQEALRVKHKNELDEQRSQLNAKANSDIDELRGRFADLSKMYEDQTELLERIRARLSVVLMNEKESRA
ncbi:MAG: hypothetical protein AAGB02_09460, partial [Pseudomonadota bacterium]